MQGFEDVFVRYDLCRFEVGDGLGDADDAEEGAGREGEFVGGVVENVTSGRGDLGEIGDLLAGKMAIVGGVISVAVVLELGGVGDLVDGGEMFAPGGGFGGEIDIGGFDGLELGKKIYTVKNGAGDSLLVVHDLSDGTCAGVAE